MFSKSLEVGSFIFVNSPLSSLYFFSWPVDSTTLTTNQIATTITPSYVEYFWSFDSTYQDLSSTFNGTPINGTGFNSSTITGYGSSLRFSSALNQAVIMHGPFLNLSGHPWTFEAWIYLATLSPSISYAIAGQCESHSTDKCLHLNVKSKKLYMGFFGDDLSGVTVLMPLKWYHVAYVFDSATRNQSIYLNGVLDSSRTANSTYNGRSGYLIVGANLMSGFSAYFDGLIDQFYYTDRAKTFMEILGDATLTLYFSFDNGSLVDGGPLRINGSLFGSTSVVAGRIGDALQIGPSVDSYFRASGLVLLGTSNQSYSMSVWINPNMINLSSIIHVSSGSDGYGSWRLGMLGLSSLGQVMGYSFGNGLLSVSGPTVTTNTWTHLVITYRTSNGLRLYVNGTLHNSTAPFSYSASGSQNYLFLGSSVNGTTSAGKHGQFSGSLDEFRLYSRELSAIDVWTLFNP